MPDARGGELERHARSRTEPSCVIAEVKRKLQMRVLRKLNVTWHVIVTKREVLRRSAELRLAPLLAGASTPYTLLLRCVHIDGLLINCR